MTINQAGEFRRIDTLFDRLFPICRSITGPGFRQSLELIKEHVPFEDMVFKSGSKVFDWEVPPEWSISEAYLTDPDGKKVVDFKEEVTEPFYDLVRNKDHIATVQKWQIVAQIQHSNIAITTEIWLRSLFSLLLFIAAILLFFNSNKKRKTFLLSSYAIAITLLAASIGLKIFTWYSFSGNDRIKLLTLSPSDTTIENIYKHNFKGKVVYVDFWGTTCPPCIGEFLNFTKPLKEKYHERKDIEYLYVCIGHKFVWRQQLTQYDIAGNHIFLEENPYEKMYRQAIGDPKAIVMMPHYLIIDKAGKIVVPDAPKPSSGDTIKVQLDKYLAMK